MKNIFIILLILILPVAIYLMLNKNSDFDSAMAKSNDLPSLLIFTSTMCLDCQRMKALVSEIENDYNDKINFVRINALDNNRKVKEQVKTHGVVLVPTLIFLDVNGQQTNKIEGFIPKEELIKNIEVSVNG